MIHLIFKKIINCITFLIFDTKKRHEARLFLRRKIGPIFSSVKNFSNTKEWLEHRKLENNYHAILPAEAIELNTPGHIYKELWGDFSLNKIFLKEVFVAELPNARYIPIYSSFLTNDNILLNDLSLEFGRPEDKDGFEHSVFYNPLPKEIFLDSTIAVIDTAGAYNYFHWILNILPKIDLFKKSNIEIDFYLVQLEGKFQKKILEALRFPMDKIIPIDNNLTYRARKIIAASLPTSPGGVNPSSIKNLYESFNIEQAQSKRRIYISRASAFQGRNIVNHKELLEVISEYGFESIESEKLSFEEQMIIFSSAEIILAPHGAGLTNIIFCKPHTKIIEIFNPHYKNSTYWILANLKKLNYFYFLGIDSENTNKKNAQGNFLVDIEDLVKTLQLADVQKIKGTEYL